MATSLYTSSTATLAVPQDGGCGAPVDYFRAMTVVFYLQAKCLLLRTHALPMFCPVSNSDLSNENA